MRILFSVFGILLHSVVFAGVSPAIQKVWAANGNADGIIILKSQADLSAAAFLQTKEQKGEWVYKTLSRTAFTTQQPLLQYLVQQNVRHQAYWVVNAIRFEQMDAQTGAWFTTHPAVAYIIPDPWVKMDMPLQDKSELSFRSGTELEWGLRAIGVEKAWTMGYKGQGIVVGGQDTGYDFLHPAIKTSYRGYSADTVLHDYYWHDAIRELNPLNRDTILTDATKNPCGFSSAKPCDDDNHGTHTMGTMVGNDHLGRHIGVAPEARWIGCRNMERGWGKPSTYIECFQFFLAPTNLQNLKPNPLMAPHVINNSWGCPLEEGCTPENWSLMERVITNLRAAGVVVVVSAGNSGSGCSSIDDPAAIFSGSFSVGATNVLDSIARFSSRGVVLVDGSSRLKPNVSAPGVAVTSSVPGGLYASFSGTSMAGPHVAGAVAVLLSANPSLAGKVEAIEGILEQTAKHLYSDQNCGEYKGTAIPNAVYGFGRIQLDKAVEFALLSGNIGISGDELQITLSPNPGNGSPITLRSSQSDSGVFTLYNVQGKRLHSQSITELNATGMTLVLPVLPNGMYIYTWKGKKGQVAGKWVL